MDVEPETKAAIEMLGFRIGQAYLFYPNQLDELREERRILNDEGKTLACHQIHVLIWGLVKGDGVVRVEL